MRMIIRLKMNRSTHSMKVMLFTSCCFDITSPSCFESNVISSQFFILTSTQELFHQLVNSKLLSILDWLTSLMLTSTRTWNSLPSFDSPELNTIQSRWWITLRNVGWYGTTIPTWMGWSKEDVLITSRRLVLMTLPGPFNITKRWENIFEYTSWYPRNSSG